jgi:hypothetical protein
MHAALGRRPRPVKTILDAREAAGRCLEWMLCDEPWKELGFAGRPKHGVLAQIFRSRSRIKFENGLKREILASITAVYVLSRHIEASELPEVVALYAAHPLIFPMLGFSSQGAARQGMQSAINDYMEAPEGQWAALILRRSAQGLPAGHRLPGRVKAGASRLSMRLVIAMRQLTRMAQAQ